MLDGGLAMLYRTNNQGFTYYFYDLQTIRVLNKYTTVSRIWLQLVTARPEMSGFEQVVDGIDCSRFGPMNDGIVYFMSPEGS